VRIVSWEKRIVNTVSAAAPVNVKATSFRALPSATEYVRITDGRSRAKYMMAMRPTRLIAGYEVTSVRIAMAMSTYGVNRYGRVTCAWRQTISAAGR